jgi:hypothetical protein
MGEFRHGFTVLGDNQRFPRPGDIIKELQALCLEVSGANRGLHSRLQ